MTNGHRPRVVYPAASLAYLAPRRARKFVINPEVLPHSRQDDFERIEATAASALPPLVRRLQDEIKPER